MNWQTSDFISKAETDTTDSYSQNGIYSSKLEEHKTLQLSKYNNPLNDVERQSYISIMNRFGDLVVNNDTKEISEDLLTEDCEAFLFSYSFEPSVHFSIGNDDFPSLYKHIKIYQRSVKQVYVDLQKKTGFQICNCQVAYGNEDIPHYEVSIESFTIRDSRIDKYRAGFVKIVPEFQSQDLLETPRKDIILEKVKSINHTLAGKPDLIKFAELLNKNTEYKLWSWEDNQCFTFQKHDIVQGFRDLQQTYQITCIVPYEVFTEGQFVMATYVYHLDHKASSEKYVWLTTSMFSFEKDLSIAKIVQQGELYLEEEAMVPFEAFTREQLIHKTAGLTTGELDKVDKLYSGDIEFGCELYRFLPTELPDLGFQQGINKIDQRLLAKIVEDFHIKWMKPIDIYVDLDGPSYETVLMVTCSEGEITKEGYRNRGNCTTFLTFALWIFENGKLCRVIQFVFDILKPIPSPYDDKDFEASNIRKKE